MNLLAGVALVLLASPCIFAFSSGDKENATITKLRDEIKADHPELVKWFERARERLNTRKNATEEDLNQVRQLMLDVRTQIHDFVTSPMFTILTNLIIEKSLAKMKPFLGVLPVPEIQEFYNIVKKDPRIWELADDKQGVDVGDLFPGGNELGNWLTNSTTKLLEQSLNETYLLQP